MLTTLRIKNLALVTDLTIELTSGFNVITGETGAGKSVILGALNLILGQRADRGLIRSGTDTCTVEAVFDTRHLHAPLAAFFDENGLDPGEPGELRIRRSFTATGTNRQFINGSPTSVAALARMGEWLVDMHGPHEHQSLLQPARQLAILDAFASLETLRREWETEWNRRKEITAERAALVSDDALHAQQLELLRHQAMEIETARLSAEEEGMLTAEFQRISNAARLMESTRMAQALLSDGEDSIFDRFGELGRLLTEIQRHDPAATHLFDAHVSATEALQELNTLLSRYFDRLDLDPERLQELEVRINLIQSLKRKYGTTVADVVAFGEMCRVKLAEWDGLEERAEQLAAELAQIDKRLLDLGGQLTQRRRQAIPRLSREVSQHLGELGFRQSRVDVELSTVEDPGATGFDHCEFQFAPNPGEPARPLRAIASSGELARVMLALKTVLASADEIPVLIFDEVDANVGGETGLAVGKKLRGIADRHQVLCITHLAPVAAQGHSQYLVSKQVTDGRTESRIERLDGPSRVAEIARMLGGQSAAARRHAEELLGQTSTTSP